MNITDLNFKYDINIEFDGDDTGGNYTVTLKYETATQQGSGDINQTIILKQDDINEMYEGALKLVKALKNHVYGGF